VSNEKGKEVMYEKENRRGMRRKRGEESGGKELMNEKERR